MWKLSNELVWIKGILKDLGIETNTPITMHCDNQAAINIAAIHDPLNHGVSTLFSLVRFCPTGFFLLRFLMRDVFMVSKLDLRFSYHQAWGEVLRWKQKKKKITKEAESTYINEVDTLRQLRWILWCYREKNSCWRKRQITYNTKVEALINLHYIFWCCRDLRTLFIVVENLKFKI